MGRRGYRLVVPKKDAPRRRSLLTTSSHGAVKGKKEKRGVETARTGWLPRTKRRKRVDTECGVK